jgi:hypothetical protein
VNAIGWIWVPTVVLLSRHSSIAAIPVTTTVAAVMAISIRKALPPLANTTSANLMNASEERAELFAAFLETRPREMDGWVVAACFYGGLFALQKNSFCIASFLVAIGVFLLTWQLMSGVTNVWANKAARRQAVSRLAMAAAIAVVTTAGLLVSGFQRVVPPEKSDPSVHASSGRQAAQQQKSAEKPVPDTRGYQRIILWPEVEKKKVAPVLSRAPLSNFNPTKPLAIPFDGSYWYFQPRSNGRGTRAHVERGSPMTVDVRSSNYIPLVMEAHQSLAAAIPLACCREIRVTIANYDNAPGIIALGVLLTDSASLEKPTLYLDQKTIVSTEPGQFTVKSSPVTEMLSFAVPGNAKIKRFDEITGIFFQDTERPNKGAKVAIKQFVLIRR